MPRLNELVDTSYNADPMGNPLPVENPHAELPRVRVNVIEPEEPSTGSVIANSILNKLFRSDDKRYQLWPEKVLREGLTGAGDVLAGKVPTMAIDPVTGDVHTSPEMIEKAQAVSALAGTGGLAGGAEGAVLNATPSLRPALKHKERLYKGKPGQEHQDIIPDALYNDFQKKALAGQDLAEYNFGFINDKGHFLSREDALKYGIDNGIIDPHSGKFGALTTTLLADSSKPGVAIEAMAKANPFFSALEHNVGQIKQAKMNGDAWLGTLSNKPGVKPEELDWTGLRSFLEENKGNPVTKQQIESHLAENKMELGEVWKGTTNNYPYKTSDEWERAVRRAERSGNFDEAERLTLAWEQHEGVGPAGATKYDKYQLPGGENYREMLMTLPARGKEIELGNQAAEISKRLRAQYGERWMTEAPPNEVMKYDVLINQAEKAGDAITYKSSHWDEPNILAHMRMNDRTIDGKKSLHLEEIQSDWHQQGRDRGYKGSFKETPYVKPDDLKLAEGQHDWSVTTPSGKTIRVGKGVEKEEVGAKDYLVRHINKGIAEANSAGRIAEADRLPDAPFKKTWHELALKRALREAAEKGYDRLSWTPGEAQAARYDLSKSVDKIAVPMVNENGTRSVRIDTKNNTPFKLMVDKDGKVQGAGASSDQFSGKPLSDVVGKEMADKIMKLDKPTDFSGDGLKIGGEGMKGFYDSIIPKTIEKLGKEHGVKVQKGDLGEKALTGLNVKKSYTNANGEDIYSIHDSTGKLIETDFKSKNSAEDAMLRLKFKENKSVPIYYIDIPPSLRDTATGKGFPLFAKGGYMLQPVDYEPEFK